jgi:hypothetical protein
MPAPSAREGPECSEALLLPQAHIREVTRSLRSSTGALVSQQAACAVSEVRSTSLLSDKQNLGDDTGGPSSSPTLNFERLLAYFKSRLQNGAQKIVKVRLLGIEIDHCDLAFQAEI